jgi:hypothetical protein
MTVTVLPSKLGRRAGAALCAASLSALALTAAGPASASTGVSGYVECLTMPVEGVWIDAANGGSGWASWYTSGDAEYAHYSYNLPNNGSYAVHVGCGGSPSSWAVATHSGYYGGTVNDFLCYDEPSETPYTYCEHTN